jgi:hypothetical protein
MDGQFYPYQPIQFMEGLLAPPPGFAVGGGGGGYTANAVTFDGTNDYLTRGGGLTGAADSKLFTASFWMKSAVDSANSRILQNAVGSAGRFQIIKNSNDGITVIGTNAAASGILIVNSSNDSVEAADGWVHVLMSMDMSDTAKRHMYIDDVSDLSVSSYFDDTLEFTTDDWLIGAFPTLIQKYNGDLAELWFSIGTYIDFSVTANRRKFIDASLKPVDLGADGSTPTGTAPIIYLANPLASWETNLGTGGGFTENGALAAAGSSPSD